MPFRILFILNCVLSFTTFAVAAEESNAPRQIIHLLDYLAKDYGFAVKDRKIINKEEYNEQVEFAETIEKMLHDLPRDKFDDKTLSAIKAQAKDLGKSINDKVDPTKISTLARDLQSIILTHAGIESFPPTWPNMRNGGKLYQANCTGCHGVNGRGDGPASAGLEPKPVNFFNPEVADNLSPFQAYNSIRLGIQGTSMVSIPSLSDSDVWDLAFYVLSMRHREKINTEELVVTDKDKELLKLLASNNDIHVEKLKASLGLNNTSIATLRNFIVEEKQESTLIIAIGALKKSIDDYKNGDKKNAKQNALKAYLDGVEPVEPKLKANDSKAVSRIESKMSLIRSLIEKNAGIAELETAAGDAILELENAKALLENADKENSPLVTFTLASGILLREGFEAVLLLIALLGVIRATGSRKAELWLHLGWTSAVLVGLVAWFFSGFVTEISGANRELMEGVLSSLAVIVLLYIGFWLHSKTEITKWKAFIDGKVKTAIEGGNLIGIALISFIAVFREAFETVLFLRAISLDGNGRSEFALFSGVAISFAAVIALGYFLLKYSSKIPVRSLFNYSSILMIALAVILTGKSLHALQEAGSITISAFPLDFKFEIIGLFPTVETMTAQFSILVIAISIWRLGKKSHAARN